MALGEKSFFWDKPSGELSAEELEYYQYSGQDFASVYASMYTTGVTPTSAMKKPDDPLESALGSSLSVISGEGMQVIVSQGAAMINGQPYLASLPITLNVTTGITDIVLRRDAQSERPEIAVKVKSRENGKSLTDNLEHGTFVYELVLATLEIPTGTIQVTPLMITDQRLNTTEHPADKRPLCGLCRSIPAVDTRGIWEDYTRLEEYVKRTWAAFISTSQNEIDALRFTFRAEFQNLINTSTREFDAWFTGEKSKTAQLIREAAAETKRQILEKLVFRSPVTGELGGIQPILYDIFNAVQLSRIKVNEFDGLGITAKDFDHKQITAYEFDTRAKQIFLVGGGTPDAGSE